jgi:hypothetical protein
MSDVCGVALIGGLLVIVGISSISKKRFVLALGRQGFFRPKPFFFVTLTEGRAKLFGCVSLLVGLVMLGLWAYISITRDEEIVRQGGLIIVTVVGTGIMVMTYLMELFIEYMVMLKK